LQVAGQPRGSRKSVQLPRLAHRDHDMHVAHRGVRVEPVLGRRGEPLRAQIGVEVSSS
jgi:hypothetical protein